MDISLELLHRKIATWYQNHGRKELPWRNTTNPYHIYISEVMLQQTQVKTVLERYYYPFLERFDSLQSIAQASEDELLKLWQGLGYYSRARNIYRLAQTTTRLPDSLEALVALPGIGKNTASAILAFGFRQPVAIMEANVKRILSRLFALKNPKEKELWERSEALLDRDNSFDYNQALMDIGSLVCKNRNPLCSQCPFEPFCLGKDSPHLYPQKRTKKIPTKKLYALIYNHNNLLALTQNKERFLGGLWGFPKSATPISNATQLAKIDHSYSHFKLTVTPLIINTKPPQELQQFTPKQIEALALSKVDEKILKSYFATIS